MKKFIWSIITGAILCGCSSFEEIKKAADAGNPEMQYEVALIYRDGDGIPADNKKSAEYMMRAVNNNYMPAAWELVQDIYRQKDVKHASDFIKAYEVLLTIKPRTFADHNSAFAGAEHIKSIGIGYLQLLAKNDSLETKALRNLFLTKLPKKYLNKRERRKIHEQASKNTLCCRNR